VQTADLDYYRNNSLLITTLECTDAKSCGWRRAACANRLESIAETVALSVDLPGAGGAGAGLSDSGQGGQCQRATGAQTYRGCAGCQSGWRGGTGGNSVGTADRLWGAAFQQCHAGGVAGCDFWPGGRAHPDQYRAGSVPPSAPARSGVSPESPHRWPVAGH